MNDTPQEQICERIGQLRQTVDIQARWMSEQATRMDEIEQCFGTLERRVEETADHDADEGVTGAAVSTMESGEDAQDVERQDAAGAADRREMNDDRDDRIRTVADLLERRNEPDDGGDRNE